MVLRHLVWDLILKNTPQPLPKGRPGILHWSAYGCPPRCSWSIMEAFSISAGLDYPGLVLSTVISNEIGRATYDSITDEEALEGFKLLSRLEGIIQLLSLAMPLRLHKSGS